MPNQCTIVTYHYVRNLQHSRYPNIKGLFLSQFIKQLKYFEKHYQFVKIEDCIDSIYSGADLPPNAILLTFDDGYIDHYINVFPILEEKGIQGCFFPSAKAVLNHKILDVNKIHFLLASVSDTDLIIHDVNSLLDKYRSQFSLKSNDYYFSKLAVANKFNTKEIIFIKRLLQVELVEELRNKILRKLFKKYVSNDEVGFSQELYMSTEQLKCMTRNGMYIGSHGHDHYRLNTLSPEKQREEIKLSIEFLGEIGSATNSWAMCYPHGAYNDSLINILKLNGCKLGLTIRNDIAKINKNNAFTLERLDTNDFPKTAQEEQNSWTIKALE